MALTEWVNSDKWVALKTKWNAVITLLKGGYTGQVLVSNGGSGDPSWQDLVDTVLPEQDGNDGKFLQTNSGNPSWEAIPDTTDRQIYYESYSAGTYRPSGSLPNETLLGSLTTSDGYTRDYLIIATINYKRTSDAAGSQFRIKKDGVTLVDYQNTPPGTSSGHETATTITWLEKDVVPGTIFSLYVYSDFERIEMIQTTFIIDGK